MPLGRKQAPKEMRRCNCRVSWAGSRTWSESFQPEVRARTSVSRVERSCSANSHSFAAVPSSFELECRPVHWHYAVEGVPTKAPLNPSKKARQYRSFPTHQRVARQDGAVSK